MKEKKAGNFSRTTTTTPKSFDVDLNFPHTPFFFSSLSIMSSPHYCLVLCPTFLLYFSFWPLYVSHYQFARLSYFVFTFLCFIIPFPLSLFSNFPFLLFSWLLFSSLLFYFPCVSIFSTPSSLSCSVVLSCFYFYYYLGRYKLLCYFFSFTTSFLNSPSRYLFLCIYVCSLPVLS